jgi:hypothetical protein
VEGLSELSTTFPVDTCLKTPGRDERGKEEERRRRKRMLA